MPARRCGVEFRCIEGEGFLPPMLVLGFGVLKQRNSHQHLLHHRNFGDMMKNGETLIDINLLPRSRDVVVDPY